jgi:RNA polymerase sigma factor (sigma-70 family)
LENILLHFVTNLINLRLILKNLPALQKQEAESQFEKHISEHKLLLYKICRIYAYNEADRQDLFQEIVIQLWKAFPKFKGDAQFSTWLYRVAINTAITGLRKKKKIIMSHVPVTSLEQMGDENSSTAEEERLQQLYKAIEQLNDVEKAIVMLYMEERSYNDMEEILGISQGHLRVKMNRIKEKLRQLTKTFDYGT